MASAGSKMYEFTVSSEYEGAPTHAITPGVIWKGLREKTTSHGLPNVDNARGSLKRTIWVGMTLAGVGILLWNLSSILTIYYGYPVDVKITLTSKRELPFPAVTICNMNPIKASMLSGASNGERRKKRSVATKTKIPRNSRTSRPSRPLPASDGQKSRARLNGILPECGNCASMDQPQSLLHGSLAHNLDLDLPQPQSKLHGSVVQTMDLGLDRSRLPDPDLSQTPDPSRHRSRRSVALSSCTLNSPGYHAASGLCFGLWDLTLRDYNDAKDLCALATLNDQSKWDFVSSNAQLFDGITDAAVEGYLLNIKKEKWGDKLDMETTSFNKWDAGEPSADCAFGKWGVGVPAGDLHLWGTADCKDAPYLTLCQDMLACPHAVYNDGANTYCYFLFSTDLASDKLSDAETLCSRYDTDATLAIVDSEAKQNHIASLGLFSGITVSNYYWMALRETDTWKWLPDQVDVTWTDFADGGIDNRHTCAMADTATQQWITSECDRPDNNALVLCQIKDMIEAPTVGPTIETTIAQTTLQPTTLQPTTEQPTTEQPTTEQPTTQEPTTLHPTTEQPATEQPTTEQPTTQEPTTQQPTTLEPTTLQPTTLQPTTQEPTTQEPTTQEPTTQEPTTHEPTTQEPTTQQPTTLEPTTLQPTTLQPTTQEPTTQKPTTQEPTTQEPTTQEPTTQQPTTQEPTTHQPTTQEPTTQQPTTQEPTTQQPTTQQPTTQKQTTQQPSTTQQPTITTATTQKPRTTTIPNPAVVPTVAAVEGSIYPERVQTRQDFKQQEQITETVADLPEEEKAALGFSANEFILDCQYAGYVCNVTEFATFFNALHGNCFIFNSGWEGTPPLVKSYKTGRRYGLKVIVNINQDEYTELLGEEAGARVVVHPQYRMPFPEDEGFVAKPGKLTSVGMRKVTINRLGGKFGNCTDVSLENIKRNVYEEVYTETIDYSMTACFKTCYQRYVIAECGCADPYYPKYGAAFDYVNVTSCDTSNITQDDCKYGVERRYISNDLDCKCPTPCNDEIYLPSVSTARWPSDVQLERVIEQLGPKMPSLVLHNDSGVYGHNLLKIEVHFEEFNFEHIEERQTYSDISLVSDVGGVLGLFLGFAVMTVAEFFELGVDLVVWCILWLCYREEWRKLRSLDPWHPTPAPAHSGFRQRAYSKGKRGSQEQMLKPHLMHQASTGETDNEGPWRDGFRDSSLREGFQDSSCREGSRDSGFRDGSRNGSRDGSSRDSGFRDPFPFNRPPYYNQPRFSHGSGESLQLETHTGGRGWGQGGGHGRGQGGDHGHFDLSVVSPLQRFVTSHSSAHRDSLTPVELDQHGNLNLV